METLLNFLLNPQSLQTLLLAAIGCSGFVWLKMSLGKQINGLDRKIDGVEASLSKRIDGLDRKIDGVEASLNKRIDGLDHKIDMVEASLNRRIDGVEASIKELKYNDFAHLNATIEALTYALEKNNSIKREDKEYVDSRLAR